MNALAAAIAALCLVACSTAANPGMGSGPSGAAGASGSPMMTGSGGAESPVSNAGALANGSAGSAGERADACGASGSAASGGTGEPDASVPLDSGGSSSDGGGGAASLTGPAVYFGATVDPSACLDVKGAGTSDGTPLEEWNCNAGPAQNFTLVDAGSGSVRLVNTAANKCVVPAGTGNGAQLQLSACDDSKAQLYTLKDSGKNGLVSIVNQSTGKCLDLPFGNPAAGTLLELYDCNQSNAQLWTRSAIASGFTGACGVAQLQAGSVLAANCKNDAQALVSSTLHLSACLSNSNGSLAWASPGGFAASCTGCVLTSGSVLTCQCKNIAGDSVATSIDLSLHVNDCNGTLTCGACGAVGSVDPGPTAFTALYGADGNDFYRFTGASSIANLKPSGWNALFAFALSVHANGDIVAGGTPLVQGGVYVGDPNWGSNVAALKSPPTTISRYEVTVGGWGDASYDSIKSLVLSQGTGPGSTLYKNFQALKSAVPGIDAINDDDEQTYDIDSSTAFGKMLNALGMKLSQAPYMNQGFWVQLKNNLGAGCDIVYLQCYQGGAGNDPAQWDAAYGNGFHVVPGQESNSHSSTWWTNWASSAKVSGGFYYPDVTWAPDANWGVAEIASGVGLAVQ